MSGIQEIVINPSPAQAEQLAQDLELLREHGAESNTAAIVEAVHQAADSLRGERLRRAA